MSNESGNGTKEKRLPRRAAVRERCLDCCGWERSEVRSCQFDTECSLHPFRMGTGKQNSNERARAIKAHCVWCMCGVKKEVSLCPSINCALFPYRKGSLSNP